MSHPELSSGTQAETHSKRNDWLTPASFWVPSHFMTSAWLEHAPFAFWLMDVLRPRSIVELGTHFGFSYFVFCEAVVRLRYPAIAHALDSWEGDDQAGFYGQGVYESVQRINSEHYEGFSHLLRGYFDDSLDQIPDGSVDLLHFDGRHRYDDIRHDFDTWLPKLSDRGVALFHDITERERDFGVWKFWDEVKGQYPSFNFEHAHGLGILAVGTDVPETVARFLMAARSNGNQIRSCYEELGAVTASFAVAQQRASEVDDLQRELRSRTELLNELNARVEGLQNVVTDYERSTSWKVTRPLRAVGSMIKRR